MKLLRWSRIPIATVAIAAMAAPCLASRPDTPAPTPDDELPKIGEQIHVDELPAVRVRTGPVYPPAAIAAGVEGTVLVKALIGRDGRVRDIRVMRSIPMLDSAAVAAVRGWSFVPAISNGKPIATWVAVPVRFALHGFAGSEIQQQLRAGFQGMLSRLARGAAAGSVEREYLLRDSIIVMARRLEPPPSVPPAAREHLARGERLLAKAEGPAAATGAVRELTEASRLAPWWPDPYRALASAQERQGDLAASLRSLRLASHAAATDAERDSLLEKCLALQDRMRAAVPR